MQQTQQAQQAQQAQQQQHATAQGRRTEEGESYGEMASGVYPPTQFIWGQPRANIEKYLPPNKKDYY